MQKTEAKKALITGVTGQDGAYLSKLLLDKGYEVFGSSRKKNPDTSGLKYLGIEKKVTILQCDLTIQEETLKLIEAVKPDEIYNLSGQSSIQLSYTEPAETIRQNVLPVLNLLESIRLYHPSIHFFEAASCEMYGENTPMPIRENSPVTPTHPYGVSKAAAFLMVKNYREAFGLFAVSAILFNHESHLRRQNFFIRNLIRTAISISRGSDEYVRVGQAENRRDFGYSPKYVEAMQLMLQAAVPQDYVVCSNSSVSIGEIAKYVLGKFDITADRIKIDPTLFRQPNVSEIYGDNSAIKKELGWEYDMTFFKVLDSLISEEISAYDA